MLLFALLRAAARRANQWQFAIDLPLICHLSSTEMGHICRYKSLSELVNANPVKRKCMRVTESAREWSPTESLLTIITSKGLSNRASILKFVSTHFEDY